MDASSQQISEADARLYDRQIRLWGAASQQKIFGARVLVTGLTAVAAEVVKNLVLAGVGHLALRDDAVVSEEEASSNFLLSAADVGRNRAVSFLPRASELNPRVVVTADKQSPASLQPSECTFDAVVCCSEDVVVAAAVNRAVREAGRPVAFFASAAFGRSGYVFCDASDNVFRLEGSTDEQRVRVCDTLEQVCRMSPLPRPKGSSASSALSVLWHFQLAHSGRLPGPSDEAELRSLRGTLHASLLTDADLAAIARDARTVLAPVCAVLGGIAGQHVLRVLTRVGRPLDNVLVFDAKTQVIGKIDRFGN